MFKKTIFFTFIFLSVFFLFSATTSATANLKASLTNVLVNLFLAILSIVGSFLVKYVNHLANVKKEETKNIVLKRVFGSVNKLLQELIISEQETISEMVKKAAKDGKITKEERDEIKKAILDKAKEILKDKGLDNLEEVFGDVKVWLEKKVEAFLSLKLSEELEKVSTKRSSERKK